MDLFAKYFNHSLRFLSYRPRSEKEVRENLEKKMTFSARRHSGKSDVNRMHPESDSGQARMTDIIEKVIDKLKEYKFLDDEAFAKSWFERRSGSRPKGMRVIQMELKQKGIAREIIERVLGKEEHKEASIDALKRLISKQLLKHKGLSNNELKQKVGMHVMRRGYDYETVKHAIDEALHNRV